MRLINTSKAKIFNFEQVHEIINIIGDLLETEKRPTCLKRDPLETKMPHQRPTCLI